jgi:hypothetical protein
VLCLHLETFPEQWRLWNYLNGALLPFVSKSLPDFLFGNLLLVLKHIHHEYMHVLAGLCSSYGVRILCCR